MKLTFVRNIVLLGCALLAVAGCGGGEGGGFARSAGTGGTGGTGISLGGITGFGSVFVNGVEFNTNSATITIDRNPGSEGDLKIGMVVTLHGSISGSSGTATSINVEDTVEGFVEQIVNTNTVIVLGQTVLVGSMTVFDDGLAGIGGLAKGDLVEVSGHVKGPGVIAASFIDKKDPPADFEVKGFITGHNHGTRTFQIGALTVNYAMAAVGNMPDPNSASWNGLFVEAEGAVCTGVPPVCGTLIAVEVEPEGLGVADADNAEVEGFVTAVSNGGFTVGAQPVVITPETRFEGGLSTDIAVGVKVEVEGVLAGGILFATEVEFRDDVKLESDVASVDVESGSLTLVGLSPITVTVDNLTEFKGGANSLADISVGGHVRIRGRVLSGSNVIATEIERRSPDPDVILQGPVSAVANPIVTILGVNVNTTGIPDQNFEGLNDEPIGRTAFFNSVQVGGLVKAEGVLVGTTVAWDEIELED